jgi:hypothetical protein
MKSEPSGSSHFPKCPALNPASLGTKPSTREPFQESPNTPIITREVSLEELMLDLRLEEGRVTGKEGSRLRLWY